MKSTTLPKKKAKSTKPEKAEKTQKVAEWVMPVEVSDWIEHASSRIKHLTGQLEKLKLENADLKTYRRFAEKRILRSEAED